MSTDIFYSYVVVSSKKQAKIFSTSSSTLGKDTVFITLRVSGWPWHIQQNQLCFMGLVNYDLIELHCCMHPPHIGLVPRKKWEEKEEGGKAREN